MSKKACGNPQCCVSSDLGGSFTFGSGTLDDNGYWEYPCSICARKHEEKFPHGLPCWPFTKKVADELRGSLK